MSQSRKAGWLIVLVWLLSIPESAPGQIRVWRVLRDDRFQVADTVQNLLSRLGRLVVTTAGDLYLPEMSLNTVFHLSPEGRLLGRLGRKGKGPREFELMASLGTTHDSLWVFDPINRRLTLFSNRGGKPTTIPFESVAASEVLPRRCPGRGRPAIFGLAPDGTAIVLFGRIFDGAKMAECVDLVRTSRTGQIVDWIDSLAQDHSAMVIGNDSSMSVGSQPLDDDPWALPTVDGTRLVIVRPNRKDGPAAFSIDLISFPGGRRIHREVIVPRAPLTSRIRDSLLDSMEAVARRTGEAVMRSAFNRAMYQPRWLRSPRSIHLMADGTVWLLPETGRRPELVEWLVLDDQLRDLARVVLPEAVKPIECRGDLLWTIRRDEDDLPIIERYRIVK